MLSKADKKKIKDMVEEKSGLISRLNDAIDERNLVQKELEVLKIEKGKQLKEFNDRTQFVEGLLSHILAKPIRIILPDGAVEHRWQPVSTISGDQHYNLQRRF